MSRALWDRHGRTVLWLAVWILAATAAGRLGVQVYRLVWGGPEVFGAVDLGYRYREVERWFAGQPVYGALDTAVYPPASYPLLWPFLGWTSWPVARALWAAAGLAALVVLSRQIVEAAAAPSPGERPVRLLAALIAPAYYATGVSLAAGQMGVHLLPVLVAGTLLLARPEAGWRRDAFGALLLLVSLVKPSFSLLFVALALVLSRRLRPALLLGAGYAGLTLLAAAFQPGPPGPLLTAWLPLARSVAGTSGYGHAAVWLAAAGLERWLFPASVALALGLGVWIWRNRDADPWLLLGVTAIVSRVWTYHQYYDDALLLLPLAAALRLAVRSPDPAGRVAAGWAVTAGLLANCLPTWLEARPSPWNLLYEIPQMLAWAALLAVLVRAARRNAPPALQSATFT